MKFIYAKRVDIIVRYDCKFNYRINNCLVNEIQDKVEEQMWKHMFKTADIINPETGEIFLTLEKDYQSFSLTLC